ncbi:MAG: hypothetical protein KKA73_28875 [Chloroflexi bacterium]|nr:hypothetical protein [Chloroflexota bacterium]MBU1751708.1 hypothetical protein [Chloroflexota bacterium]
MDEQKSFVLELVEVIDRHLRRPESQETGTSPAKRSSHWSRWLRWLGRQMIPNIGTLLLVVVLLVAVPTLAAPLRASLYSNSTSTISYQGRLADSGGNPLTGKHNLEFRVYDVPTGGTPLWTEMWTGANSLDVSDGLFNVMLGSIDNTLASSIEGHDELYLGITVGTDSEMTPRVQLGSVPFSMQALTVPDGSITSRKISPTMDQITSGEQLDLTTEPQVVPNTQRVLHLETDSRVLFTPVFELYTSDTATLATGRLWVDGSSVCTCLGGNWTSANKAGWRGMIWNSCIRELSAGDHTVELRAHLYSGTSGTSYSRTGYTYLVLSQ